MRTISSVALGVALFILSAPVTFAAGEDKNQAAQTFSKPIPATGLDEERGGKSAEGQTQIINNNQTQIFNTNNVNGTLDNVTVINSITGGNLIDGGSFANSSGFPTVIQNSGNGVLIQNSTILNVTIQP
jgi:hypothetical protein